jgi:hypothetical protein
MILKGFTVFIFSIAGLTAGTGPKVLSVFPPNQLINADHSTTIAITFDSAIDPVSITDTSFYVFGRWSGATKGILSFTKDNTVMTFMPDKPFYTGELVAVNLSKRIKNKSGIPMQSGYAWNFWIKTGPGNMKLIKTDEINVRLPGEGWIQTYGAYAGDLDMDGYTEFYCPERSSKRCESFLLMIKTGTIPISLSSQCPAGQDQAPMKVRILILTD